MAKTGDILCPVCAEFVSERDNPFGVLIWAEQPDDRVGTSYDLSKVPPLLAILSKMRLPRIEICDQCCFVATKASDGTRTGPPIFTVDLTLSALRGYLEHEGASVDVPGLSYSDGVAEMSRRAKAASAQSAPLVTSPASPATPATTPANPPPEITGNP